MVWGGGFGFERLGVLWKHVTMTRDWKHIYFGHAKKTRWPKWEDSEERKPRPGAPGSPIQKWMSKSGNTKHWECGRGGQKKEKRAA